MDRESRLVDVIEQVYAAGADGALWADALTGVADLLGGVETTLEVHGEVGTIPAFFAAGHADIGGGAGRIEVLHNAAGSLSNQGTVQVTYGAGNPLICDPTANILSVVASADIGMAGGPVSPVPLPAGLPLFGIGLVSLAALRRWCKPV